MQRTKGQGKRVQHGNQFWRIHRTRLQELVDRFQESLFLVSALYVVGAVVLASLLLALDACSCISWRLTMPTLAFLLDVDNTLLANDDVKKDFDKLLRVELGPTLTQRFWDMYERVRHEKSVVDIPLSLKRVRHEVPLSELDEQTYLHVHSIFDHYPFFKKLYPYVFETLAYLKTLGTTVIVSDGDLIFQAKKIVNSHLANAVDGRVLLYTHKQEHIDDILKQYPADHYVMIDDKPQILVDSKRVLGDKLTVVFVRQGKYAKEKFPDGFVPDIPVNHIGDVRFITVEEFLTMRREKKQ